MESKVFKVGGKFILASTALIAIMSTGAFAETINFATGQNSSGVIQTAGNSLDANWTATNVYTGAVVPAYVTTSSNADWYSGWNTVSTSNASWIAPFPNDAYDNGNYSYSYSFNLTGYNLATAVFSGMQFTQDDSGQVWLNGIELSGAYESTGGSDYSFQPFTVPTSDLLQGVNTLTVTQEGTDDYLEAFIMQGTLTVSPSGNSSVPEPATMVLFGAGLAVLAGLRLRRKE